VCTLIILGALAHGLSDCEIVTGCGTVVADDEVLFFLYKEEPLYVRTKLDERTVVMTQKGVKIPLNSVKNFNCLAICIPFLNGKFVYKFLSY
jgi:hypothetical protein